MIRLSCQAKYAGSAARCGVDPERLKDSGYIEYQFGLDIEGREVSFGTKDEEYNNALSWME